jgi:tripeptidyl-peptidase-1
MSPSIAILFLFSCFGSCFSDSDGSQNDWSVIGKPSNTELINIIIALKQTNVEWLEDMLKAVSDPESPQYGRYVPLEDIVRYVHPHPNSIQQIKDFFTLNNSIDLSFTLGNGFAKACIPVGVAERIFSTKFYTYQYGVEHKMIVRATHYVIPHSVEPHVSFIWGIDHFPIIKEKRIIRQQSPDGSNDTGGDVTPLVIDKAYNVSGYSASNNNTSQAVAGFLGQYFSPEDLKDFQSQYQIPLNPVDKVVGDNNGDNQGIEANLDVQYITGVGRNVDTWFISITSRANDHQEDFLTWVLELINDTHTPLVHSISYGDYESSIDASFMDRVDQEFMKLGISGRTILFASGDSGTSCSVTKGGRFEPMWPASSPYVTTVGGTVSTSECWDHGGGGFSDHYQTPSYQLDAVTNYINGGLAPNDKYFNSSGRGYPDLSVFSINYLIIYISIPWPVDGTSCATPTTAGIVSLLNDVRLNGGEPPLGFVNPLLYKLKGKGFYDIVKGTNRGRIWCKGFTAGVGWDPTSGWGSPNFEILRTLIMNNN